MITFYHNLCYNIPAVYCTYFIDKKKADVHPKLFPESKAKPFRHRPSGRILFHHPTRSTLFLILFLLGSCLPAISSQLFPTYSCILDNVRFWEDIYSRYSTRQGVLHDKENLAIVYEVVELVNWNEPGSTRINRKRIKLAKWRYKEILSDLADGEKPTSDDEKRVAAMFQAHSKHAYHEARDNIRLQIGQKDRFLKGIIRSGAYLPSIKTIFRTYGLPTELAYLPHVESSFNPKAHSKAGAAGLWQFTRSTGRQYMTINNIVDERYDPLFATRAAAVFLKENFEELESWPLAITAYNYGRSGMKRAVQQKNSYEEIFNTHRTRIFKFASRNFYPEFLAAMNVARRIEKNPAIIPDRPEATISHRMKNYVAAQDLLSYFQVARQDFSRLNPSLRDSVFSGKKYIPKGFLVRLPATARIRNLVGAIPPNIFHTSQIRDREYIVRRGDTAGSIARRYKISLAELVQANGLDRRAMIRIGQKLKIPSPAHLADNAAIVELRSKAKIKPN